MSKALLFATGLAGALAFQAPEHADISMSSALQTTFLTGEQGTPLVAANSLVSDPETIARNAIAEQLGKLDLVVTDKYTSKHNGVTHVYFRQRVNDLLVSNAEVNVNVGRDGEVLSIGSSVLSADRVSQLQDKLARKRVISQPLDAVKSFLKYAKLYEGDVTPTSQDASLTGDFHSFTYGADSALSRGLKKEEQTVEARLMYTVDANNELELTWAVNVESEKPYYAAYVAHMSASDTDSEPLEVHDLVKWFDGDGTYLAFNIPDIDPNLSGRARTLESEVTESSVGSPEGWHRNGAETTTRGNNVIVQENQDGTSSWENNYRPVSSDRSFQYNIDWTQEPREYIDASLTNLWFWNNQFHDLMYAYGWDELAGNMQEDNFGNGGRGGDALQANGLDGAGFNNANQFTPSDGNRGRQRMYLWNQVRPMKDGDFDSGIIIHEYAHSLSTRLTGGPSNSGCLGGGEAGGMGEGWGDTLATFWSTKAEDTRDRDFPMGEFAADRGIRQFPYSTSSVTNDNTYDDVGSRYARVHSAGAVWANILFNVLWDMRDEYGYEPNWFNVESRAGNIVLLQNIIDGMKLQPCRPTMIAAMEAIYLADEVNYNGEHYCTMQKAFAARGMGIGVRTTSTGSSFGTTTPSFVVDPSCPQ